MVNLPKISIVTVCYQAADQLAETMQSVISQDYPNVEYILVDGGSTDGTLDIIKQHESHLAKWVSEPDKGIYDAMNKGAQLATGEWINFMNVGDAFASPEVLTKAVKVLDPETAFLYGRHIADYGYFRREHIPKSLDLLWQGMLFSHQALFVKTQLLQKRPFDLTYKMSADYDFIYEHYVKGHVFQEVPEVISVQAAEGASETQQHITYQERWDILKKHNITEEQNAYHRRLLKKRKTTALVKKVLPAPIVRLLTQQKYSS